MIEVVIKIPESIIEHLKDGSFGARKEDRATLVDAVMNGTLLPKGHGDLIDRSKIYKAIPAEEDNCTGMGMTLEEMDAYNDGIDAMYNLMRGAKPIIEADKESDSE